MPATPDELGEVELEALEKLRELGDDAFVELATKLEAGGRVRMVLPNALLVRYLESLLVPGRQLLVFDSDEEVSSQVAANMLGVSRPYLNELLDIEAIPYRRVGNQRRVRVAALDAYMRARDRAERGLESMADIVNQSAGGWNN